MSAQTPFEVNAWARDLIHGCGGLHDYEYHEIVAWPGRDVGIVDFVLWSLANPRCKGSAEVLEAIHERRAKAPGGQP